MKALKARFRKISRDPYVDPERETYRHDFNIIDDYLCGYDYYKVKDKDGNECPIGFIVFIDPDNDIDWKDTRDKTKWSEKDRDNFALCIGRLTNANSEPIGHLSFDTIRTFRIKIGAGYILTMNKCFDDVDRAIGEAVNFLRQRNAEKSRQIFLFYSTLIVTLVLGLWCINRYAHTVPSTWATALLFGVLGAYFSIWTRYGKLTMTGLSSRSLHFLETLTRMIIGAISSVVFALAIKSRFIFPVFYESLSEWSLGLLGFFSGFSERIIPSLMEMLSKKVEHDD